MYRTGEKRGTWLLTLFFCLVGASAEGYQAFNKNAAQYCLRKMSAVDQQKYAARLMNLGASYGHGCPTCDLQPQLRDVLEEAGDLGWIRRQYIVHFALNTRWKNRELFKGEFFSIIENDGSTDFTQQFSKDELKQNPYRSRWLYDPRKDALSMMDLATEQRVLDTEGYEDAADLVGGATVHTKVRGQFKGYGGHVIQLFPGIYASGKPGKDLNSPLILDYATDDTRSYEMMKYLGDKKLYKRLLRRGWKDEQKREELIEKTVKRIQAAEPTYIVIPDAFFWDSVPWLMRIAERQHPSSFLTRILTSRIVTSRFKKLELSVEEVERNMHDDYFEVLARVSRGEYNGKVVPVFLATLIDNPGKEIIGRGLQNEFSELIGTFVQHLTGLELTDELRHQFSRVSYEQNDIALTDDMGSLAKSMDADDEALAVSFEKAIESGTLVTHGYWGGLLEKVVIRILQDFPLLLKSADKSFVYLNDRIREFTARTDNNVHLVNVDSFYLNFHKIVHPKTLHPSVAGAQKMAELVSASICRRGQTFYPEDKNPPGPYPRFKGKAVSFWHALDIMENGPQTPRIKVYGHHWRVSKAEITRAKGLVTISGQLIHMKRLNKGNPVDYKLVFDKEGHLLSEEVSHYRSSKWYKQGRQLLRDLGSRLATNRNR